VLLLLLLELLLAEQESARQIIVEFPLCSNPLCSIC
jgi:hypothetical protein